MLSALYPTQRRWDIAKLHNKPSAINHYTDYHGKDKHMLCRARTIKTFRQTFRLLSAGVLGEKFFAPTPDYKPACPASPPDKGDLGGWDLWETKAGATHDDTIGKWATT